MSRCVVVFVCLLCLPGWSQETRGTLSGRVIDPTGAVIPGVDVKATNVATNTTVAGRTNDTGNYIIPYLLPGVYNLSAEKTGFKRVVQPNIEIRVNDTVDLEIRMVLGSASESVTVAESAPLLETATSSLGQVVDHKRIADLPVGGGNPFQFVLLTPGVTNTSTMEFRDAASANKSSSFATDGNSNYSNEFMIDGVPNTNAGGTNPFVSYSPPTTTVTEFKVQTVVYDASLGHTPGAVINVATKSGTNQLHGELHEWFRDRKLDAPNFFQNRAGQRLPVYHYHRYGVSGGGPVYLPRLYDGRNKTFWFYGYEANPRTNPTPRTVTVPLPEQLRGDFSGLLAVGANYQVYDPATIQTAPNGRTSRSPFPGNIIPSSRIDPLARNLSAYWPAPNQPGTVDGRTNYYSGFQTARNEYFTHFARVDHAFSENHRAFLRLHYDYWLISAYRDYPNESNGAEANIWNRGLALDDVIVFNPTFLFNFRYGLTRNENPERRTSRGFDLAGLGFSNSLVGLTSLGAMPNITLDVYNGFGSTRGTSYDIDKATMIHSFAGAFTKLAGAHTLRFGTDYRVYRAFRNAYGTTITPDLSFSSTYTRGPLDNSPAAPVGQGLASFLLGIPTGGQMSRTAGGFAEQELFSAFYVQDDWRLTSKFTVNVGLRYEYETPITERFDRSVTQFDFDAASPVDAAARARYASIAIPQLPIDQFRARGGLLYAGVDNRSRGFWNADKNNFMPRIGFAWAVQPKTVLRGGFGVFFETNGTNRNTSIQSGFSQATPVLPSLDNGLTFAASLANPFPNGLRPPLGAANGLATNLGQSVTFFERNLPNPYAQRWSFGIQRQLPWDYLIDVSYVANKAVKLPVNRAHNAVPASWLSRSPVRDDATNNLLSGQVANPFQGLIPGTSLDAATVARSQLLKPYPQFSSITSETPQGYSWYHSLQARIEKRFAAGYSLNIAYTWSKFMEAVEFLNESDPLPYRSISSFDRNHRIVISGIYELPFGRGRRFGSAWPGALNVILGGWQVNAVLTGQAGAPLGFGNAIFNGDLKDIPIDPGERTVDRWFNTAAGFERNTARQLVSNVRTFPLRFSGIRAPGQHYWDLSALKRFQLRERLNLEFRAEAYNALNHPNFNAPDTSPTSSAFGRISGQNGNPRQWQLSLKIVF